MVKGNLSFCPTYLCATGVQPMDAGIIASIKGLMRKKYGQWCLAYVSGWLKGGGLPEEVNSASVVR